MTKSDIIAEYNRAEIHYQAMKALMKSAGISVDGASQTEQKQPAAEQKQPAAEQKQPAAEQKPTITEPGIVYDGSTDITLKPGESTILNVYFNGVSSTSDFVIIPNISSPAYNIKAIKTADGYKDEITVKGISGCSGTFKMYLKTKPEDGLTIKITVRG